ncbi:MAG: hypothetical protein R3E97_04275 [Candidatus Eisenbacteria bacterium]
MSSLRSIPRIVLVGTAGLSLLLAACGTNGDTTSEEATEETAAAGHVVATFLAPELDEAGTKTLVAALASNPGIMTAAAVPDSGLFRVAFASNATSAAEVLGAVTKTNPRLALRDVVQVAGGAADACAACPSRTSCGDAGEGH